MPRRHLTGDERAIRRARGIAIWRVLPFPLMLIALIVMSTDDQIFKHCIGRTLEGSGRGAAWVRLIVSIPCSPYYLRDFADHWLNITVFFVSAGFAIPQFFWIRRHEAYWDMVREKERLKRAAITAQKAEQTNAVGETERREL